MQLRRTGNREVWAEIGTDMKRWRRNLHMWPELAYEETRTASLAALLLTEWGFDVTTGLAETGVLGTLRVGSGSRSILLRADMDALPIQERSCIEHASERPNIAHLCGHDGHTATLLGAARYLAEQRNFSGTLHVLFQPAEEATISGAATLLRNGALDHLDVDAVYGLHTWPALMAGNVAVHDGTAMAAADFFEVEIGGKAAHAGIPGLGCDAIVAASQVVSALQTIVSRTVSPNDLAVVTVGTIQGGEASTQVADRVRMTGTVRGADDSVVGRVRTSMGRIVTQVCAALGARGTVEFRGAVPAVVNASRCVQNVVAAAGRVVGRGGVHTNIPPSMAAEDFAFLLGKWPGCFFWLGGGTSADSPSLHDPTFDFNDETLVIGARIFAEIVELELPAGTQL
ncbi:Amidohydrolase [Burkholderia aenigmatica]|uniref:Amidohydrolase n=1 Tax=Burkholderia aenigmatica TaxID=2015348 RepID=A0A6P2IAV8_9BURK|nr:amidohydrolase [Burkholderia aenigmatica]VWB26608.1 Amidohydrolase [Burkholderia aenigmatica]